MYTSYISLQWCGRGINHYKSVKGAGAKVGEHSDETPPWRGKNRDELMNYTVRVSLSNFMFVLLMKSVSVSWQNGELSRYKQ